MGKIKGILKEKDLTIKGAAESLGISSETISNWDKEKTSPTISQFGELAKYIKVSFNELRERVYGG